MSRAVAWARLEWARSDRGLYLVVAVLSSLLAYLALELWRADLTVPLAYWGDALAVGSHFKTVIENGWYEYNPLLGAPYGQTYHDFPTADNLNFVAAKILGWFISDWAIAVNVYFLLGFPLAALAMVYLLRICGVSKAMTLALAPVFAIAPYHFMRGIGHLFLASYFVIPLSLVIVIRVVRGRRIWGWRDTGNRWLRPFGRGAGTLVILALTATAQTYYAIFFLLLLVFAGVVALIARRRPRRFAGAAVAGVLTVVGMVLNMIPDTIYAWVNGANPTGLERGHAEAEIYALKLAQLLLPWPGHRISFLRSIREQYDAHYPLVSEFPALGAIAAGGLVALFLFLAYAAARAGRFRIRDHELRERSAVLGSVAALTFVAFIFSTVGGLSTIISFVTSSLRGWNRMSIYIAALSLIAVGVILDLAIRAVVRRARLAGRGRAAIAALTALCLLAIGFVDQTPADAGSDYAATAERFHADRAWFSTVQQAAGEGAMIMQLPYQSFPEDVGPTGVLGSEVLIPYLHTTGIAWTGGGIKGRPRAEWTEVVESQYSPAEIAAIAVATGMAGIHIDRSSLFPAQREELERGLTEVLGEPLESADGRFAYFSLSRIDGEVRSAVSTDELAQVATRATNPVTIDDRASFTRGFDEQTGALRSVQDAADPALTLINDSDAAAPGTLELTFRFASDAASVPSSLDVVLPDGSHHRVEIADGTGTLSAHLDVPPGKSTVGILGTDLASPLILLDRGVRDDTVAAFATAVVGER
jgi:phosphoglycerol transferase